MSVTRDNSKFFGIDLFALYDQWRAGWREALRWRWLAWLAPQEPVRLLLPDGTTSIWRDDKRLPDRGEEAAKVDLWRVQLPDEIVLAHTLLLPVMSQAEMFETVRHEAEAAAPFPADKLAWGWHREVISSDRYKIIITISSRNHIERHLASQQGRLRGAPAEVCARLENRCVIFNGYGDNLRVMRNRRHTRRLLSWLLLIMLLFILLNAVPLLQASKNSKIVSDYYNDIQSRTAETVTARDNLRQGQEQLTALTDFTTERAGALPIIENLSRLLPDDSHLERLDIQPGRVRLTGLAVNASAVVQILDQQPEYRNVRLSGAIVRGAGGHERFSAEFEYGAERQP
ncbi:MAG: PilN domain-containing protein [Thiohalomonadaceae bacterium]